MDAMGPYREKKQRREKVTENRPRNLASRLEAAWRRSQGNVRAPFCLGTLFPLVIASLRRVGGPGSGANLLEWGSPPNIERAAIQRNQRLAVRLKGKLGACPGLG